MKTNDELIINILKRLRASRKRQEKCIEIFEAQKQAKKQINGETLRATVEPDLRALSPIVVSIFSRKSKRLIMPSKSPGLDDPRHNKNKVDFESPKNICLLGKPLLRQKVISNRFRLDEPITYDSKDMDTRNNSTKNIKNPIIADRIRDLLTPRHVSETRINSMKYAVFNRAISPVSLIRKDNEWIIPRKGSSAGGGFLQLNNKNSKEMPALPPQKKKSSSGRISPIQPIKNLRTIPALKKRMSEKFETQFFTPIPSLETLQNQYFFPEYFHRDIRMMLVSRGIGKKSRKEISPPRIMSAGDELFDGNHSADKQNSIRKKAVIVMPSINSPRFSQDSPCKFSASIHKTSLS